MQQARWNSFNKSYITYIRTVSSSVSLGRKSRRAFRRVALPDPVTQCSFVSHFVLDYLSFLFFWSLLCFFMSKILWHVSPYQRQVANMFTLVPKSTVTQEHTHRFIIVLTLKRIIQRLKQARFICFRPTVEHTHAPLILTHTPWKSANPLKKMGIEYCTKHTHRD